MGMQILVVDDDDLICQNVKSKLQRLLGSKGACELFTAHTAVEAELIAEKKEPDVIITDLNMPGISGLELIKHVKKHAPHTRIFVLSGYDDYDLVREAFLNGADDYLLKPVDINELEKKIVAADQVKEPQPPMEQKGNYLMQRALAYIDQNIRNNISMDEVARYTALSYHYFSVLFKEYTGMGFSEYIHRHRIELSKRYLEDPSIKIGDLARKVGYESASTYSKVFKKYEGIYPTDYRNRLGIDTNNYII